MSDADRIAAIRKRVARIEHMPYLDAAQMAARVALSEDVPWLLHRLAEAEARAEKAGEIRSVLINTLDRLATANKRLFDAGMEQA